MDRLETFYGVKIFTFQYGQIRNVLLFVIFSVLFCIYIPVWIDQKHNDVKSLSGIDSDLHSSMDRLETLIFNIAYSKTYRFTFQYGQIRNFSCKKNKNCIKSIYIPVWIDQKLVVFCVCLLRFWYLHSSMDRLETSCLKICFLNSFFIYIPVWIDQKLRCIFLILLVICYLHSSMDRLETSKTNTS